MKKLLIGLGVIFLILLVAAAGVVGYAAHNGKSLDASSKAYVDENLPPIVSTWSKDELLKRASPQLVGMLARKPEQLDQLFGKFSQLGGLKNYESCKGDTKASFTPNAGEVITAAYSAKAQFENGEADIRVRLIRIGDQWKILFFYVDSPIFLN